MDRWKNSSLAGYTYGLIYMYMDRQIDKKFSLKNEIVLYKATIFYLKFKRNYSCLWNYVARYEKQKQKTIIMLMQSV